jgi:hypothetical protein
VAWEMQKLWDIEVCTQVPETYQGLGMGRRIGFPTGSPKRPLNPKSEQRPWDAGDAQTWYVHHGKLHTQRGDLKGKARFAAGGELEGKAAVPKAAEPKAAVPKAAEPKAAVPKAAEPKAAEPKAAEPKAAEPRAAEPRAAEPRAAEPRAAEPRAATSKPRSCNTQCLPSCMLVSYWPNPSLLCSRPSRLKQQYYSVSFMSGACNLFTSFYRGPKLRIYLESKKRLRTFERRRN